MRPRWIPYRLIQSYFSSAPLHRMARSRIAILLTPIIAMTLLGLTGPTPIAVADQGGAGLLSMPIALPQATGPSSSARTSSSTGPSSSTGSSDASLKVKLATLQAECASEVERIRLLIEELRNGADRVPPNHLVEELELWERLELLTAQRISTIDDLVEIRRKLQIAEARRLEFERKGLGLRRPYSFTLLDDARDQLFAVLKQEELTDLEFEAEEAFLIDTKDQRERAERARREAMAALDAPAGKKVLELQRAYNLTVLRSRALGHETLLHRERCDVLQLSSRLADAKKVEMQTRIQILSADVRFSRSDLEKHLARIDSVEQDIRSHLAKADRRLRHVMRERSSESSSVASDTSFETARDETQLLRQLLSEVGGVRECWRRRYALVNGNFKPAEPDDWLNETRASVKRIERLSEKLRLRMHQQHMSLASLQRQKSAGGLAVDELQFLNIRIADIEHLVESYGATHVLVTGGQRLYERFVNELEDRLDTMSWSELARRGEAWVSAAWSYEITSIDDQPITVSKIILGIVFLLAGYWISRLIAAVIARVVLPKLGLSPAAIAPLRTVVLYLLVAAFTFLALDVVNVPLTVFAFMGGAIAIGVGFGSQNLVNNFISGLILLVERPIRIGDLVNVDGIEANIERIGARSTRVRTGSNLDILVPNSKFLENNVTNWTLSNTRIRTSVTVGVSYGSPVATVIEVLDSVVRNHPKVLDTQDPIVLFKEFGDNSLNFEVHFWVHMRKMMDSRRVESDVRVEIDSAFRDKKITIAFPQRDVHIDMQAPIEVRLAEPTTPSLVRRAVQKAA